MTNIIDFKVIAQADFAPVYAQLSKLRTAMAEISSQSMSTSLTKGLTAQLKAAESQMLKSIAATKAYTAETVAMETASQRLTRTLEQGKFTIGQYASMWSKSRRGIVGELDQIANAQARMAQSMIVPSATKQGLAHVITANQGIADAANKAAIYQRALNTAMRDGTIHLINFGKNTQWAGRQLTAGLTMPLMMAAGAIAKVFYDVDKELTKLGRVYGAGIHAATSQQIAAIKKDVISLSQTLSQSLGISAKEVAALAADFAQAGQQGEKLLKSTAEASKIMVLGEVDKQEAVKATIAIQNAYKLNNAELTESINFLNTVQDSTSTSFKDLIDAVPRVGPIIKDLGGTYKDTAAMLVAMKEGGVSVAEGANALKNSFGRLLNPTKAASDMLKGFGINLAALISSDANNPTKLIIDLQKALDRLDPLSRSRAIAELFGKFQFARMTALFNNFNKAGSQSAMVMGLMGASAKQLEDTTNRHISRIQESASGKFRIAIQSFKAQLLPIGEQFLKLFTKIIQGAEKVMHAFNKLGPMKNIILGVLGGVTVMGPIIMITGLIANLVGQIFRIALGVSMFKKGFVGAFRDGGGIFKGLLGGVKGLNDFFVGVDKSLLASQKLSEAVEKQTISQAESIGQLTKIIEDYTLAVQNVQRLHAGLPILGPGGSPLIPTSGPVSPRGIVHATSAISEPYAPQMFFNTTAKGRAGLRTAEGGTLEALHVSPFEQTVYGTNVLGIPGYSPSRNALRSSSVFPSIPTPTRSMEKEINGIIQNRQMPILAPAAMTEANLAAVMAHYSIPAAMTAGARNLFSLETVAANDAGKIAAMRAAGMMSGPQLAGFKAITSQQGAGSAEAVAYIKSIIGKKWEEILNDTQKNITILYQQAEKEVLSMAEHATASFPEQISTISARYGELIREQYVDALTKMDTAFAEEIGYDVTRTVEKTQSAIMEGFRRNPAPAIINVASMAVEAGQTTVNSFKALVTAAAEGANRISAALTADAAAITEMSAMGSIAGTAVGATRFAMMGRVPFALASGGKVIGPGGPTTDSIPAMLSDGEYVVKASSVNKYGYGFLDAVNNQRFAKGGAVGFSTGSDDAISVEDYLTHNGEKLQRGHIGTSGFINMMPASINRRLMRTSAKGITGAELALWFSEDKGYSLLAGIGESLGMDEKYIRSSINEFKQMIVDELLKNPSQVYGGWNRRGGKPSIGINFEEVIGNKVISDFVAKHGDWKILEDVKHIRTQEELKAYANDKNYLSYLNQEVDGQTRLDRIKARLSGYGEGKTAGLAIPSKLVERGLSSYVGTKGGGGRGLYEFLLKGRKIFRPFPPLANGGLAPRFAGGGFGEMAMFEEMMGNIAHEVIGGVAVTPFLENALKMMPRERAMALRNDPEQFRSWAEGVGKHWETSLTRPNPAMYRATRFLPISDPYAPMTLAQAEKMDATLLAQARSLENSKNINAWKEFEIQMGMRPRFYTDILGNDTPYVNWLLEHGTTDQITEYMKNKEFREKGLGLAKGGIAKFDKGGPVLDPLQDFFRLVKRYTVEPGWHNYNINDILRSGTAGQDLNSMISKYGKTYVEDAFSLSEYVSKMAITAYSPLYRGLGLEEYKTKFKNLKPGDTFSADSLWSASENEKLAKEFRSHTARSSGFSRIFKALMENPRGALRTISSNIKSSMAEPLTHVVINQNGKLKTVEVNPFYTINNEKNKYASEKEHLIPKGTNFEVSEVIEKSKLKSFFTNLSLGGERTYILRALANGGIARLASGGKVFGAGGPTDDKIPAYLSNGEYVVNAGAVSKYGVGFMNAVNAGKFAEGGIAGFAEGSVGGIGKFDQFRFNLGSISSQLGAAIKGTVSQIVTGFNNSISRMVDQRLTDPAYLKQSVNASKGYRPLRFAQDWAYPMSQFEQGMAGLSARMTVTKSAIMETLNPLGRYNRITEESGKILNMTGRAAVRGNEVMTRYLKEAITPAVQAGTGFMQKISAKAAEFKNAFATGRQNPAYFRQTPEYFTGAERLGYNLGAGPAGISSMMNNLKQSVISAGKEFGSSVMESASRFKNAYQTGRQNPAYFMQTPEYFSRAEKFGYNLGAAPKAAAAGIANFGRQFTGFGSGWNYGMAKASQQSEQKAIEKAIAEKQKQLEIEQKITAIKDENLSTEEKRAQVELEMLQKQQEALATPPTTIAGKTGAALGGAWGSWKESKVRTGLAKHGMMAGMTLGMVTPMLTQGMQEGTTKSMINNAGMGAMMGSMLGPEGMIAGVVLGAGYAAIKGHFDRIAQMEKERAAAMDAASHVSEVASQRFGISIKDFSKYQLTNTTVTAKQQSDINQLAEQYKNAQDDTTKNLISGLKDGSIDASKTLTSKFKADILAGMTQAQAKQDVLAIQQAAGIANAVDFSSLSGFKNALTTLKMDFNSTSDSMTRFSLAGKNLGEIFSSTDMGTFLKDLKQLPDNVNTSATSVKSFGDQVLSGDLKESFDSIMDAGSGTGLTIKSIASSLDLLQKGAITSDQFLQYSFMPNFANAADVAQSSQDAIGDYTNSWVTYAQQIAQQGGNEIATRMKSIQTRIQSLQDSETPIQDRINANSAEISQLNLNKQKRQDIADIQNRSLELSRRIEEAEANTAKAKASGNIVDALLAKNQENITRLKVKQEKIKNDADDKDNARIRFLDQKNLKEQAKLTAIEKRMRALQTQLSNLQKQQQAGTTSVSGSTDKATKAVTAFSNQIKGLKYNPAKFANYDDWKNALANGPLKALTGSLGKDSPVLATITQSLPSIFNNKNVKNAAADLAGTAADALQSTFDRLEAGVRNSSKMIQAEMATIEAIKTYNASKKTAADRTALQTNLSDAATAYAQSTGAKAGTAAFTAAATQYVQEAAAGAGLTGAITMSNIYTPTSTKTKPGEIKEINGKKYVYYPKGQSVKMRGYNPNNWGGHMNFDMYMDVEQAGWFKKGFEHRSFSGLDYRMDIDPNNPNIDPKWSKGNDHWQGYGKSLKEIQGHATGGPIYGAGTKTSDSIPAYLSNGEYVIKADSVNKYGTGFFDAVNAGRFANGGAAGEKPLSGVPFLDFTWWKKIGQQTNNATQAWWWEGIIGKISPALSRNWWMSQAKTHSIPNVRGIVDKIVPMFSYDWWMNQGGIGIDLTDLINPVASGGGIDLGATASKYTINDWNDVITVDTAAVKTVKLTLTNVTLSSSAKFNIDYNAVFDPTSAKNTKITTLNFANVFDYNNASNTKITGLNYSNIFDVGAASKIPASSAFDLTKQISLSQVAIFDQNAKLKLSDYIIGGAVALTYTPTPGAALPVNLYSAGANNNILSVVNGGLKVTTPKSATNQWATGGYVSGPGTGTSDSINAMLSNGEFVMKASTVNKYGISLLNAMNAGVVPTFDMSRVNNVNGIIGAVSQNIPQMGGIENNYNINVNVSGTNLNADDVARAVMAKLQQQQASMMTNRRM